MPHTALDFWPEVLFTLAIITVLLVAAFALAVRYHPRVRPGSAGHREGETEEQVHGELVRPDGLIDSFAGVTEEAGGSLPWLIKAAFVAVGIWWVVYLVLFFAPSKG